MHSEANAWWFLMSVLVQRISLLQSYYIVIGAAALPRAERGSVISAVALKESRIIFCLFQPDRTKLHATEADAALSVACSSVRPLQKHANMLSMQLQKKERRNL